MKKEIKKVNELKIIESFIQTDYLKGYKYVDLAGEILNHFYTKRVPPKFNMDLSGLSIYQPDSISDEIRISSNAFWSHFINPSSLDQIMTSYLKKYNEILKILGVQSVSRIGWRIYFSYTLSSKEEGIGILKKFSPLNTLEVREILLYAKDSTKLIENNIRLSLIKKVDEDTYSLLFDLDFYKYFETDNNVDSCANELKELRTFIQSQYTLDLVNSVLK